MPLALHKVGNRYVAVYSKVRHTVYLQQINFMPKFRSNFIIITNYLHSNRLLRIRFILHAPEEFVFIFDSFCKMTRICIRSVIRFAR